MTSDGRAAGNRTTCTTAPSTSQNPVCQSDATPHLDLAKGDNGVPVDMCAQAQAERIVSESSDSHPAPDDARHHEKWRNCPHDIWRDDHTIPSRVVWNKRLAGSARPRSWQAGWQQPSKNRLGIQQDLLYSEPWCGRKP